MENVDLFIVFGYLFSMIVLGIYLSARSSGNKSSQDYFLAGKSLPWWAVGGSLIASNISAEQFIGMSGSGYVVGLAIASYEFMAAAALLVVAKFFFPVFLKHNITTMPQFLEKRFDNRVKSILAMFWVALFVFVNVTSVLYLGALAIKTMTGLPLIYGIVGLALYAATFSIFGGLRSVVLTDLIQVIVLFVGGAIVTYFTLEYLAGGFFEGLSFLYEEAPEKFDMILSKDNPEYKNLPGLGVLIGGMWIANLYYWGSNQYIIQRALAARNIKEAQKGMAFAAFVKLFLPLLVVIPGIAAFVSGASLDRPDEAYPWALNTFVGVGFKGVTLAALIAAIGSSLSSMVNSTATILTLDIVKPLFSKKRNIPDTGLVRIGKVSSFATLVIGVALAPLFANLEQTIQFIQEYTGFISPGVVAVFLFGLFWKRATANAAFIAIVVSIPLSIIIKACFPMFPFLDRMGLAFLILSVFVVVYSSIENYDTNKLSEFKLDRSIFRTSKMFNLIAVVVVFLLIVIYGFFG